MWRNFVIDFLDGLCWLFIGFIFILLLAIALAPIALALMYSNAWWLLSYIIIIPSGFGIYNVCDNNIPL